MIARFYENVILNYKKSVIAATLLLTFAAIYLLPGLRSDPNPFLLPDSHEAKINLERLKKTYTGSNDRVVILLEAEDTIFKPSTLASIKKLTQSFSEINLVSEQDITFLQSLLNWDTSEVRSMASEMLQDPYGLEALAAIDDLLMSIDDSTRKGRAARLNLKHYRNRLNPIIKVTSLANIDNIIGVDGNLEIYPVYESVPLNKVELERTKQAVLENDLFINRVVDAEGKLALISVEVSVEVADPAANYLLYHKIEEMVSSELDMQYYIAGVPVTSSTISIMLKKDMAKSFPIVILLVLLCLYITLRMFNGLIVPMLVVFLTIIMTLAVQVIFDVPINIVNSTLPVFLICIGVSDGIHIFSEFRGYRFEGMSKHDAILKTMSKLLIPIALTSITTAVAFLSLMQSEIVQVRQFGMYVAVGSMIALLLSATFIPAMILLLPEFSFKRNQSKPLLDRLLDSGLILLTKVVIRNSGRVLLVAVAVASVSIYGITQVVVDNDRTEYFKPDTELVRSAAALNEKFSGSESVSLLITAPGEEPFKEPENLRVIEKIQGFIDKQELVGRTYSIVDIIKRMNLVLHNNDEKFNVIPKVGNAGTTGRDLISQYLLLYENGSDDLSDSITTDFSHANVRIGLTSNSTHELEGLLAKIDSYLESELPPNFKADYAGTAYVNLAGSKEIIYGQMKSFVLSLVIVLVILAFTYRSLAQGVIGTLPLLFSVFANYGLMGLIGLELNIGTALISTVAIGIGVDYSIHYLSRLREGLAQGMSTIDAMLYTISHSGKAITLNALTVGVGFLALLFSEFTPIITIGWTIMLTMLTCCMSTIILIPAVVMVLKPKFVYENGVTNIEVARVFPETQIPDGVSQSAD